MRRPRPRAYCSSAVVQGKALAQRRRREKQKRVAKWQHDEDEALWDLLADPEVDEIQKRQFGEVLAALCRW